MVFVFIDDIRVGYGSRGSGKRPEVCESASPLCAAVLCNITLRLGERWTAVKVILCTGDDTEGRWWDGQ